MVSPVKRAQRSDSGEGRTRTGDTPVFSRVLYQLSYLAPDLRQRGANRSSGAGGAPLDGVEPVDQRVDEVALEEHAVGTRLGHGAVQHGVGVAGQRDEAEVRVILPEPRDGGDPIDERHVQVDHDGVGSEGVRELDRREPVGRGADDRQLRLVLDQRLERFQEPCVVVRKQDAHRRSATPLRQVDQGRDVSLAAVSMQPPVREVVVIGAPLDLGQGRRGVDMGPSAIRYAELKQHLSEKLGIAVEDLGDVNAPVPEATDAGDDRARFLPQILELCDRVAQLVAAARAKGATPLVLGGDHSIALGTLVGMASAHGAGGVVWVDAHGDLNTPESSPSGNVHGMVLAAALGLCGTAFQREGWTLPAVEAGRISLVGIRSLDQGERDLLRRLDAKVFTMSEIDRVGIEPCMREALAHASGPNFVHMSLDMDVVDPEHAPGVGTPVRGGLSYREAHLAMEIAAESGIVDSLDVVEVNPVLDRENATAKLAVELVASAFGARIL
jgi:arginase